MSQKKAKERRRQQVDFDPLSAFRHAEMLRQSMMMMEYSFQQYLKHDGDHSEAINPYLRGSHVLTPFLVELYLKVVAKVLDVPATGGHDVESLFASLPDHAKSRLTLLYLAHRETSPMERAHRVSIPNYKSSTVSDTLKANKRSFEQWRYLYEDSGNWAEQKGLQQLMKSLRVYIVQDLKPEWREYWLDDKWVKELLRGEKPSMKLFPKPDPPEEGGAAFKRPSKT